MGIISAPCQVKNLPPNPLAKVGKDVIEIESKDGKVCLNGNHVTLIDTLSLKVGGNFFTS